MRWRNDRQSGNVEDRRGMSVAGRTTLVGGGAGVIIIILLGLFLGVDPSRLMTNLQSMPEGAPAAPASPGVRETGGPDDEMAKFVSVVLADTEDVWNEVFRRMGKTYREPKLVLFSGAVNSACGMAESATGPFYCPGDEKVYIDLSFYQDLKNRFQAPGDFAQAYVIAHEVGHHVQNLLGIMDRVNAQRARLTESESNKLLVRLELQADFFAGLWANHAHRMKQIIEPGDVEEALNAATAIGDDRLQRQSRGYVTPDSFTHGTSAQRTRWFRRGLETGDLSRGDTFAAPDL
ncbi:MAG: zinc metallopeptidase [Phycisphaerae bacterium]|nr:zinc metallopeptidase [Phycisphaerae bacterium]